MLYSWVVTRLFATWVGSTSRPTGPPIHPQQLWAIQAISLELTLVAWKFGSTITKIVRSHSHLCWFECMKANELTSSAPHTSGWRPARAETAHTVTTTPHWALCTHVCPHFPPLSARNGSLQLFDRDASIVLLLQANTPPCQTSTCSTGVVARLFAD